jgi:phosphohistidine swiveling domain-containing protein
MAGDRISLGTKAQSLARLTGRVKSAEVLPLVYFDHRSWQRSRTALVERILGRPWARGTLIVRSSALSEDSAVASQAGQFLTVSGVRGELDLDSAVDKVFASYGDEPRAGDQVLVLRVLSYARTAGVACTRQPSTGAPYTVVSWSESPGTDIVTGGRFGDVRTWYGAASARPGTSGPGPVHAVLQLLTELRELTGESRLDVEFAFSTTGRLVLLQVRPLVCAATGAPGSTHRALLSDVDRAVTAEARPRRDTIGTRTIFGVMPDWNPAEIIGLHPRPLALSLYRLLVTDEVWARARHRYGYRDLRGTPLLVDFLGLPYIDVRASITSLIPRDVPTELATRLVDHWTDRLEAKPHLHDRIESQVVISSSGLRPARLEALGRAGFTGRDVARLGASLRKLTGTMLTGPLWTEDLRSVRRLRDRPPARISAPALRSRLRDCVEHGTLPFAGLARAAFAATELLDDLVAEEVLSEDERSRFIGGLGLIAGELRHDFHTLDRDGFLDRYGHLRPGTYDIRSPRYDEKPEYYFDWSARKPEERPPGFHPSGRQRARIGRLLTRSGLSCPVPRLLTFIGASIRGREWAKFEFTRVLSDVLADLRELGERHGFDADDMSFTEASTLRALTGDRRRDTAVLAAAIDRGRRDYEAGDAITLPPLLTGPQDVWSFTLTRVQPSFVTRSRVLGKVADIDAGARPDGAIALVSSADPGYDWLFARGIVGLVTAFGGVNSHMAIRALELGIPAVIGAGEDQFRKWCRATALELDAANGHVAVLP